MDLGLVDDVVFLVLTFIMAAVLTLGILIWGRTLAPERS